MTGRNRLIAQALTYSGTLPFMLAIAAILVRWNPAGAQHDVALYGAIIVSFLSGIQWGVFLQADEKSPYNLFIISNVFALAAWASLLMGSALASFSIQLACLALILLLDYRLARVGLIPRWFYDLRRNATGIVIVSLNILLLLRI